MNWLDASARAHLLERVGPTVYRRMQSAAWDRANIATVNGYTLRQIGGLVSIVEAGRAFTTEAQARRVAAAMPPHGLRAATLAVLA